MATAFIALPLYCLTKASSKALSEKKAEETAREKRDLAPPQALRDGVNVAIFTERLAEYSAMRDQNTISREEFSQLERELQHNLLSEVAPQHKAVAAAEKSGFILPLVCAILIPLLALALYAGLSRGSLAGVALAQEMQSSNSHDTVQMMQLLIKLASHLHEHPNNPHSWMLLAQSYMKLQQYALAAGAFKHLLESYPQDPSIAAYYAAAVYMADARTAKAQQPAKMRSLQVLVAVADTVESDPGAAVFVFARAANGAPMPLALRRLLRSDLPKRITLDGSMAMMAGMGLANFDQVQVVARISSAGIAKVSPDDYEARSATIDLTQEQGVITLMLEHRVRDKPAAPSL